MSHVLGEIERFETSGIPPCTLGLKAVVLVIGAGVVGLSLAIMLASQGVEVIVCEACDEKKTSRLIPMLLLSRTMEIYESLGLAEEIRQESERCYDETAAVLAMETLTSPSPTAIYLPTLDHRANELSPAPRAFLTQHILLRILRRRVNSLPLITLRYNCPVVSLAQHERRVIAQTSYGKIVAHYCVGCDGSSGITRKLVTGEKRSGRGLLTKSLTIVFRANIKEPHETKYLNSLVYIHNPMMTGLIRLDKTGESGILVVYTTVRRIAQEMRERRGAKAQLATQIVQDAIGINDIKIDLITGEDWTARSVSAEYLQNGRIFLAGDAARQMAPIGGFGGNTGVQDAHNIAWKLSLVLRSQASPALLATYHTERHPAGVYSMEQAYSTWRSHCFPAEGEVPDGENLIFDLNLDFGQRYHASAGIAYVGGARGAIFEDPFWPSATPGSRTPHIWFRRGDTMKSLYEYFEITKFVLLCSGRGTAWIQAQESTFKAFPLKVAIVPLGEFFTKYKIRDTGAVLVRPDGYIGWKAVDDSEVGKLGNVLKQLLGFNVEEETTRRPQMTRANTSPDVTGVKGKRGLVENPPARKGTGLLQRMTTLRLGRKGTS